jgi:hypothetical protein
MRWESLAFGILMISASLSLKIFACVKKFTLPVIFKLFGKEEQLPDKNPCKSGANSEVLRNLLINLGL